MIAGFRSCGLFVYTMKIIQMFQNTMLKRPLTRDRFRCASHKTHTGLVSPVVFVVYAEELFAWRCDRMLHPTYTSKLNTLLRWKFKLNSSRLLVRPSKQLDGYFT